MLRIMKHVEYIHEVVAKHLTRAAPCMGPRRILAVTTVHPSSQPPGDRGAEGSSFQDGARFVSKRNEINGGKLSLSRSCGEPLFWKLFPVKRAEWRKGTVCAVTTTNVSQNGSRFVLVSRPPDKTHKKV